MQKLVYILPEYQKNIGTHFYHNVELLERAQKELDLFLIIEKGERPAGIEKVYVQKFRFLPLRVLELKILLLILWMCGYKTFYTHYSFVGSIFASFFGKSFYWNCGMPWLYKRSFLEEFFFRFALRRSILVTGTEGMKKEYVARYMLKPERVRVLPNWINLARFEPWRGKKGEARAKLSLTQYAKIVLFLHRLSKRKGANMIAPVACAFEGDQKILFLVVGTGPLAKEISGKNIRLAGEVAQTDVPLYMAAADIFFMPSEEEGFPHVILEAMAMGVPIVASDVGGVKEFIAPSLLPFVVKQNVGEFQEKITQFLIDSALANNLALEEKECVARFSLEKICRRFLALIQDE